jgi:Rieske Fe-S protein
MERRDFIKTTCAVCIGGYMSLSMLEGCGTTKMVAGSIVGPDLIIPLSDFGPKNSNQTEYEKCVIVRNEILQYPIYIYRIGDNQYKALWMRCTHQGTELHLSGDRFECPAHGSQFDNRGMVLRGPAAVNLKTFPVTIENNQLKVSLK